MYGPVEVVVVGSDVDVSIVVDSAYVVVVKKVVGVDSMEKDVVKVRDSVVEADSVVE